MYNVLAIDLGFSSIKWAYTDPSTKQLVVEKMISAIAKLPEAPLDIDDEEIFQLGSNYFVIGQSCLDTARSYQLSLTNFDELKEAYPAFISYSLKRFGDIHWDKCALGLSMRWSDKADELLDHLYNTLMIPEESNFFSILPQGLSSRACFSRYHENLRDPHRHATDNAPNSYVICDIGYETCDICSVVNQKAAIGATLGLDGTGIRQIALSVQDDIYKQFGFLVSPKEAQIAVDSCKLRRRGREYDLTDMVNLHTRKYLMGVLDLLEERYSEFLDSAEKLLIVGGGSYPFSKWLKDPEFKKEVEEKHFPASFIITPDWGEYYNAASYLLIANQLWEKEKQQNNN